MNDLPRQPVTLRLAGDGVAPGRRVSPRGGAAGTRGAVRGAARRIGAENARAAGLSPTDARWVLALRVAAGLEGGAAAVLPPERRRRLVAQGAVLGLREFDSNLVIAIVQDAVRSGEGATSAQVEGRLGMVRAPGGGRERASGADVLVQMVLAVLLAVVLLVVLVRVVAG